MKALLLTATPEEEGIIDLIRNQLTDTISNPTDEDCLRFALRAAARELAGKPSPRSPRPHQVKGSSQ